MWQFGETYGASPETIKKHIGLEPEMSPHTMTEIYTNRENLKSLLKIIQERSLEDNVNWQAFRKMYMDLDKQFAVPKRPWYSLEEYIGWWRIPFSWLLELRRIWRDGLLRTFDRWEKK